VSIRVQMQTAMAPDGSQPIPTFDINKRTPLAWKPWFRPDVHKQEFLKWMNGDKMMQLLQENPKLEELCTAHLLQIDTALAPPMPMPADGSGKDEPKPGGGSGQAMNNSNSESAGSQNAGDHTAQRQP
jgi:hypothetical protein